MHGWFFLRVCALRAALQTHLKPFFCDYFFEICDLTEYFLLQKKYKRRSCRFKHSYLENKQSSYESLSCKGCLLNLNKRGKVKRLKGINPNLRPAHFLPREIGRTLASKREKVVTIDFSNYLPNNTGEPVIEAKRSSFTADEKLRGSISNDKVQSKKNPRAPSEQSNNFARHFSPKKRINNKSDAGLMKIITNAQFDW